MRGEVIHRQMVILPAGAALLQPHVAAGDFAFIQRRPPLKAKAGAGQRDIVLHPAAQPRLNVDIIGLQPQAAFV